MRLVVCLLCAVVAGAGYFLAQTYKVMTSGMQQRQHLIDMTNAFTSTFSMYRDEHNIVPATFRRIGIQEFTDAVENNGAGRITASSMRMPGTPGLELNTTEMDPTIRSVIERMATTRTSTPHIDHLWRDGQFIGRTVVPSIASSDSCVSCHNATLGEQFYDVGDVMGAFVVETDLTGTVTQGGINAIVTATVIGSLIFAFITFEAKRSAKTVIALKRQVSAEQKRRKAEEHAKFLASHDSLTKSANRSMFYNQLEENIAQLHKGEAADVVIALIDLDDFKLINDSMGHDAGDAVLVNIAQRLRQVISSYDGLVARFGGDEFALALAPKHQDFDPAVLGRQLIKAINQEFQFGQSILRPSCSVGIAPFSVVTGTDTASLMKAADMALYAAKDAGKSRFQIFDEPLRAKMGRKKELISELPQALENQSIRPVLQPKIDLQTGDLIGFEALARWRFKDQEIPRAEFIPLAEECRMIEDFDFHILHHAAVFVAQASRAVKKPIGLSVNISTIDLGASEFVEKVLDVLLESGLSPTCLTLEITESVFMQNWEKARQTLEAVRKTGVKIALDDFGTGYSSLSYILEFPFDEIKIDRSLAKDVHKIEQNRGMLVHLTRMFHDLNKTVTIEGVETWEQTRLLMDIGVHVAQGFYFARPLELDEAMSLLAGLHGTSSDVAETG